MVSSQSISIFLDELSGRPIELMLALVEDKHSLRAIFDKLGIPLGFDRVGVLSALEILGRYYSQNQKTIQGTSSNLDNKNMENKKRTDMEIGT